MIKKKTVYWLVPAKPEGQLFRALIRILAKQYGGPRFKPHLTLFVAPEDRQSPAKILRKIKAAPIRLKIEAVSYSAQFTKTLYVRFGANKEFKKLAVDLGSAAGLRIKAPMHPHVSLLYKNIPEATKKQLASTLKLPVHEVVFDTIRAVRCAVPTRTCTDVESWRALVKKRLK